MHPITYGRKRQPHSPPRKRPKTTVEVLNNEDPSPQTPSRKPKVTYLSRTPTHPALDTPPNSPPKSALTPQPTLPSIDPFTPQKPAKDLSGLFDFSPSPSKGSKPVAGSGSGVAKRMLSRSRTESSFDSASSSKQSLASISSSSQFAPDNNTTSRSPSPSKTLPPPIPIATSTTTHARTYAGKSRSFLISLPTSSLPPGSAVPLEDDLTQAKEDSETRESYTDLRTRWGVDNSEDDPHPRPVSRSPSPSNSQSHSRAHSPTKHSTKGKGKEKEQQIVYPNGLTNDLKSITELRSKGESRRFLDELGYLFEGLEPSGGIGARRASALEIVTKLCSTDFARKAKATDFHTRAWDILVLSAVEASSRPSGKDKILSTILVFFAALVAGDSSSLVELAQAQRSATGEDFVGTLVGLLDSGVGARDKDGLGLVGAGIGDAELKKAGVGRTEKPLLTTLYTTISKKSGLFSPSIPISTRFLITHTLSALPPSLLSPHHLPTILHTLRSELHPIPSRITAYISGLSLLPPPSPSSYPDIPSFQHIENCLRLLDSFLLGQWSGSAGGDDEDTETAKETLDGDREDGLANELVASCIISELMLQSQDSDIAAKCTEIAFRVLLSLTQDSTSWCRALLKDELTMPFIMRTIMTSHLKRSSALSNKRVTEVMLEPENDTDAQVLDRLCLALGLLTNLVQVSDAAKDFTRKTRLDATCTCKRACIRACQCPQRVPALNGLAQVYIQQSKDGSTIDPGANFLRGHIAVLLGLLMRDNKSNQKVILAALPGLTNRSKLASLAEQAREFVTFYAELAVRLSAAAAAKDKDDEEDDGSATRSNEHNVERMVSDGNGNVARDVISFLEKLSTQQ